MVETMLLAGAVTMALALLRKKGYTLRRNTRYEPVPYVQWKTKGAAMRIRDSVAEKARIEYEQGVADRKSFKADCDAGKMLPEPTVKLETDKDKERHNAKLRVRKWRAKRKAETEKRKATAAKRKAKRAK